MILVPIVALLVGAMLAFLLNVSPLPGNGSVYMAMACLAGIDTVCGGIRGGLEAKFRSDVFITGFVSNVGVACFLVWFGENIQLNLPLAVSVVLGTRIFTNLSLIRRFMLTKWLDARERQRLMDLAAHQQSGQVETNP